MKKDYGNSQVLMCDYTQAKEIKVVLSEIADQVAGRLRHHQVQGEVVSVGIDYADAEEAGTSVFGVQMKIYPTNHTDDLSQKNVRTSNRTILVRTIDFLAEQFGRSCMVSHDYVSQTS